LGYTNLNYLVNNKNLNATGSSTTILNSSITTAGVYIVNYSIKFISTSTNTLQIVASYVNLPSTGFSVANQMMNVAQNIGPFDTLNNVQFSGTWSGKIEAGTLSLITYATYNGAGTLQANANVSGGTYLSFTRIA
jgi:hypothetical protein